MIPQCQSPTSTSANRVSLWLDLMRTSDKLLLAGLRRRIGPHGDLREAYRRWYADHMREHDEVVQRIATRLGDHKEELDHAG